LLFSLVNTSQAPVIILVGQLIRTFGLFMVVVNTAMFWLLIRFALAWQIQEPAGWILGPQPHPIAVTLLDALLGLDQPQLDEETGTHLAVVQTRLAG
jgi:uncharacterized membrane protein YvlD (DUF360 family)